MAIKLTGKEILWEIGTKLLAKDKIRFSCFTKVKMLEGQLSGAAISNSRSLEGKGMKSLEKTSPGRDRTLKHRTLHEENIPGLDAERF